MKLKKGYTLFYEFEFAWSIGFDPSKTVVAIFSSLNFSQAIFSLLIYSIVSEIFRNSKRNKIKANIEFLQIWNFMDKCISLDKN